jgi:hypothetical protein
MKALVLETQDGLAILGYAGLGATTRGTEPSHWMNGVLRGRGLTLEGALGVLADAMRQQMPRHLNLMPPGQAAGHNLVAHAFVGRERRIYTIDMVLTADRRHTAFRHTRHQWEYSATKAKAPAVARAGSGAMVKLHGGWKREIQRLLKANERGQVSAYRVADALAQLNYEVHRQDSFVGPNSIVIWRYRTDAKVKWGGGGQAYIGTSRDSAGAGVPTIVRGIDMTAVANDVFAGFSERVEQLGWDRANSELSRLLEKALVGQFGRKPDDGPFE